MVRASESQDSGAIIIIILVIVNSNIKIKDKLNASVESCRWRSSQRRSLLLVCFVIKSWTCFWSLLRVQLSLSLCCCFSSSATLRIKANFQMPSVFRLVIWTLDCFHSSWPGCLRCARAHPPFFSCSLLPALFRCTCKAPKDTLQWVRLFLSLSLSLSLCVCVCAC